MENTCLMLMASLYTAVDLEYVIDKDDLNLEAGGLEKDHHLTILFNSTDTPLERRGLMDEVREILGPDRWSELEKILTDRTLRPVFSDFGLDRFENPEYDALILRLRPESPVAEAVKTLNKALTGRLGEKPKFGLYRPHLTLAYLKPGMSDKYLMSDTLLSVLTDSRITYDDFMLSHQYSETHRKQWYLTQYNCIERHLRNQKLFKNLLGEA